MDFNYCVQAVIIIKMFQAVIIIKMFQVLNKPIPVSGRWGPIGLRDIENPTFSRQSAHRLRGGCQPYELPTL
jgi:hypothetical protein